MEVTPKVAAMTPGPNLAWTQFGKDAPRDQGDTASDDIMSIDEPGFSSKPVNMVILQYGEFKEATSTLRLGIHQSIPLNKDSIEQ